MAAILFFNPKPGTDFAAGDKLYFYTTATTTDLTVYQDSALSTPHAQPVVADADGVFAPIYIDATGDTPRVKLFSSADVEQWDVDPFPISDLTALTASVATNTADIATLEGQMTTAEGEIDSLQVESSDYEDRITTLEAATTVSSIASRLPVAFGSFAGSASPTWGQNYGFGTTITRSSAGTFAVTFSTARANANYVALATAGPSSTSSPLECLVTNKSTAGFTIETWYLTGGSTRDKEDRDVNVVVFDADQ